MPNDEIIQGDVTAPVAVAENPRAVAGGNNPPSLARMIAEESGDFARLVTEYLEATYGQYVNQVNALRDGVANLPETVTCPEDKEAWATTIKAARDLAKKIAAFHAKEKNAYLRGGQGADQFAFGLIDILAKRSKANRPGVVDVGLDKITDYDRRVLAEENERRRLAAVAAAREAQRILDEQAEARRRAAAAQLAADRARTEENRRLRAAEAQEAEQAASAVTVDATVATQVAQEAHIETLARPADIMRNRGNDGVMTTMGEEKFAEVVDRTLLDKTVLWAFLPTSEIEKALRAWAKTTDYNVQMAGASIGRRPRSQVR